MLNCGWKQEVRKEGRRGGWGSGRKTWRNKKGEKLEVFVLWFGMSHGKPSGLEPKIEK